MTERHHGVRTPFEHIRVTCCGDCDPGYNTDSNQCDLDAAGEARPWEHDDDANPPDNCPLRRRAFIVYLDPPDWDDHPDETMRGGKWCPGI